jgi:hypothetical protein
MIEIILEHLTWYPLMGPRDVYKLIFQGVMGSEHLISSPEGFINYLREEFDPLPPDPTGRLLEALRSDRVLLRINLRPYKALQKPVDQLIPALLETAHSFKGDPDELRSTWMDFVQVCEASRITTFDIAELHEFTTWLEGLGFPALHHSEAYQRAYQPAYRLIAAQYLHGLGIIDAG